MTCILYKYSEALWLLLHRFQFEEFGDFLECFVFGFGQTVVQVHKTAEAWRAEQYKRVVETSQCFKVQVEFGHKKAEEKVHSGTDCGT